MILLLWKLLKKMYQQKRPKNQQIRKNQKNATIEKAMNISLIFTTLVNIEKNPQIQLKTNSLLNWFVQQLQIVLQQIQLYLLNIRSQRQQYHEQLKLQTNCYQTSRWQTQEHNYRFTEGIKIISVTILLVSSANKLIFTLLKTILQAIPGKDKIPALL